MRSNQSKKKPTDTTTSKKHSKLFVQLLFAWWTSSIKFYDIFIFSECVILKWKSAEYICEYAKSTTISIYLMFISVRAVDHDNWVELVNLNYEQFCVSSQWSHQTHTNTLIHKLTKMPTLSFSRSPIHSIACLLHLFDANKFEF